MNTSWFYCALYNLLRREEEGGREVRDSVEVNEFENEDELSICDMEVNDEGGSDERGEFVDERTGKPLDPSKVREARLEELRLMRQIPLYDKVPVEECWGNTGRAPISTKWLDVNKGTDDQQDVRSRLVARDFKPKGDRDFEDLFAAMPPLEAKKI